MDLDRATYFSMMSTEGFYEVFCLRGWNPSQILKKMSTVIVKKHPCPSLPRRSDCFPDNCKSFLLPTSPDMAPQTGSLHGSPLLSALREANFKARASSVKSTKFYSVSCYLEQRTWPASRREIVPLQTCQRGCKSHTKCMLFPGLKKK